MKAKSSGREKNEEEVGAGKDDQTGEGGVGVNDEAYGGQGRVKVERLANLRVKWVLSHKKMNNNNQIIGNTVNTDIIKDNDANNNNTKTVKDQKPYKKTGNGSEKPLVLGQIQRGMTNAHWYKLGITKAMQCSWLPEVGFESHPDEPKPLVTGKVIPGMKEALDIVIRQVPR